MTPRPHASHSSWVVRRAFPPRSLESDGRRLLRRVDEFLLKLGPVGLTSHEVVQEGLALRTVGRATVGSIVVRALDVVVLTRQAEAGVNKGLRALSIKMKACSTREEHALLIG